MPTIIIDLTTSNAYQSLPTLILANTTAVLDYNILNRGGFNVTSFQITPKTGGDVKVTTSTGSGEGETTIQNGDNKSWQSNSGKNNLSLLNRYIKTPAGAGSVTLEVEIA